MKIKDINKYATQPTDVVLRITNGVIYIQGIPELDAGKFDLVLYRSGQVIVNRRDQ